MIIIMEAYAAMLEFQCARMEYAELFRQLGAAYDRGENVYGTPLDYATWSMAAYTNTAEDLAQSYEIGA